MLHRFVQEPGRFLGEQIRRVLAVILDRWVAVARHPRGVVAVGPGVEQEVGAIEAARIGLVVVVLGVAVPQLADVVRVVPCVLHPQRQVVIVPARLYHLRVPAVRR